MLSKTSALILATLLINASTTFCAPIRITRELDSIEARDSADSSSIINARMIYTQIFGRGARSRTSRRSRLVEDREEEPGVLPRAIEARDTSPSVDEPLQRRYPRRVYYEHYQKRQDPGSSTDNGSSTTPLPGSSTDSSLPSSTPLPDSSSSSDGGSSTTPLPGNSISDSSLPSSTSLPDSSSSSMPSGTDNSVCPIVTTPPSDTSLPVDTGSSTTPLPDSSSAVDSGSSTIQPSDTNTSVFPSGTSTSSDILGCPVSTSLPSDTSYPADSGSSTTPPPSSSTADSSLPSSTPLSDSSSSSDNGSNTALPPGSGSSDSSSSTSTPLPDSGSSVDTGSSTDTSLPSSTNPPSCAFTPPPAGRRAYKRRGTGSDTASLPKKRGLSLFRSRSTSDNSANNNSTCSLSHPNDGNPSCNSTALPGDPSTPAAKRAYTPRGTGDDTVVLLGSRTGNDTVVLPEKRSPSFHRPRALTWTEWFKRELRPPEKRSLSTHNPRALPWRRRFKREISLVD